MIPLNLSFVVPEASTNNIFPAPEVMGRSSTRAVNDLSSSVKGKGVWIYIGGQARRRSPRAMV